MYFCRILALKLMYRVVQLKNKCSGCYAMWVNVGICKEILRNGRHHGDRSCPSLFKVKFDVL